MEKTIMWEIVCLTSKQRNLLLICVVICSRKSVKRRQDGDDNYVRNCMLTPKQRNLLLIRVVICSRTSLKMRQDGDDNYLRNCMSNF